MLKYVLLGLLAGESRHGYELKAVFEELLAGTWPLNIGQVYTTLSRLEQEGLVEAEVVPQDLLPDRKVYSLTQAGRSALAAWCDDPVEGPVRLRDEFFMKVLVRSLIPGTDPLVLVREQRRQHVQSLAALAQAQADPALSEATALLVEGAILRLEADVKWLDVCEQRFKERKEPLE
jgi:DNA-binding PadR family transcriptional regulator